MLKFLALIFLIFFNCDSLKCQNLERNVAELSYDSLIEIGKLSALNKSLDSAIIYFTKALSLDTNRVESYYGLGYSYSLNCFHDSVNCKESIYFLKKSLTKNPHYRRQHYNLALCSLILENYFDALTEINIAIENEEIDSDYFIQRSNIKFHLGDLDGACQDLKKAKALNGKVTKDLQDILCK